MSEKTGIENLRGGIKLAIAIGEGIDDALQDGKVDLTEGIGIALNLTGVQSVDWKAVPKEAMDIDNEEKNELIDFVSADLDLNNDAAEEEIEDAVALLFAIQHYVSKRKRRSDTKKAKESEEIEEWAEEGEPEPSFEGRLE